MKHYTFLIIFFSFVTTSVLGQTVITMEKSLGVYMIPCIVNGTKMKMVFDTGASTVTISMEKAKELYNTGKLRDEDFLGVGQTFTASGDIVDHLEINLRTIQIGGQTIKNTRAVIISGQNAPLLLGLSAIQKLGKIILDGNKLQIVNNSNKFNATRAQIEDYILSQKYNQAIALLKKIEDSGTLNNNDICNMIMCCSKKELFEDCLQYCGTWLDNYKIDNPNDERFVCEEICYCLYELKEYKDAIQWIEITMKLIDSNDLRSHYVAQLGSCYYFLSDLDKCLDNYYLSTQMRLKFLGLKESDILNDKVHDSLLGRWYQRLSMNYALFTKDEQKTKYFAKLGAKCGNIEAQDFCKYAHIDF